MQVRYRPPRSSCLNVKCLKIIIFKLFIFGYWWFLSAILVKESQLQFLSYYNEHVHMYLNSDIEVVEINILMRK